MSQLAIGHLNRRSFDTAPVPFTCSANTLNTVCPRSSDPFYKVSYYIKWVNTSWTYSMFNSLSDDLYLYPIFKRFPQFFFQPDQWLVNPVGYVIFLICYISLPSHRRSGWTRPQRRRLRLRPHPCPRPLRCLGWRWIIKIREIVCVCVVSLFLPHWWCNVS